MRVGRFYNKTAQRIAAVVVCLLLAAHLCVAALRCGACRPFILCDPPAAYAATRTMHLIWLTAHKNPPLYAALPLQLWGLWRIRGTDMCSAAIMQFPVIHGRTGGCAVCTAAELRLSRRALQRQPATGVVGSGCTCVPRRETHHPCARRSHHACRGGAPGALPAGTRAGRHVLDLRTRARK